MIVVIDSDIDVIPNESKEIPTYGMALLNMLRGLGYDAESPPLADLLQRQYNLEGEWAIVSPIHWQASHNDALIVAVGKELALTQEESQKWFRLFDDFFAEEGMLMQYHTPDLWLISISNKPALNAKPAYLLRQRSLLPQLATLDDSLYWQKFITESQMLLASLPNNGTFNGVWVWGNTKPSMTPTLKVCADNAFFETASLAALRTTLYTPSIRLKDYQMLVLSDMSQLSDAHQQELKQLSVSWYWNNVACHQPKTNCLKRFWRHFIHAD